ncbi:hypothetical protein IVB27_26725 [Bradyrhizobium sp. 197]|uniref:hypothetical protein n=1 Tax=Bradyrhizobium sp. 197 TaxID=2782663 RepID=UPI001FFAA8B5|nr:hypothetical protein [Bradyrhizobium sp. 197]MCK1478296.1 hypothetical protein [Bradyrhizobium sp. 197]
MQRRFGSPYALAYRPDVHDALIAKVPANAIYLNKGCVSVATTKDDATATVSDATTSKLTSSTAPTASIPWFERFCSVKVSRGLPIRFAGVPWCRWRSQVGTDHRVSRNRQIISAGSGDRSRHLLSGARRRIQEHFRRSRFGRVG